jgi:hypothetical protein
MQIKGAQDLATVSSIQREANARVQSRLGYLD